MKKVLSILLAAAMVSSLWACGAPASKEASAAKETPAAEDMSVQENASQAENASSGESAKAASDYEYPEMTIILAHSGAATDARQEGALAIEKYIEETSGGKIQVDVYPAGQLGDSNTLVESVQNGGIQMCIQPPANVCAFNPLLSILDVPYFFPPDIDKARAVFETDAADALLDTMQDYDMVGLGYWVDLFKAFTSNVPLRAPEDFNGLKFRVMASPVLMKFIESLGGTALTIDYQETFTALQTGAIDGQEAGIGAGIYNMKFYEVQKYMEITNHILASQLIFANKTWFEGLDDPCKQLVMDAVNIAGNDAYQEVRGDIEQAALDAIGAQCEIITLTDEELQAMSDACRQPCLDLYIESNGEAGQKILDAFNADIEKLN